LAKRFWCLMINITLCTNVLQVFVIVVHIIKKQDWTEALRMQHLKRRLSAFRDRGVPGPTSECRRVPQPRWVEREGEREGGRARRPETGVREVGIPRPSCSSRAQVGCTCSRGLQASTREREASGSKRAPVSSSSPRGQPSLRGPWSFLL
jgi:hypothetical protein